MITVEAYRWFARKKKSILLSKDPKHEERQKGTDAVIMKRCSI